MKATGSGKARADGAGKDHADAGESRMIAGIDLGSSSVRMCVAQAGPDGRIDPLETLTVPICLGADTFRTGRLSRQSIRAACDALNGFRRVLEGYGVSEVRAVATSAVREASNSETFVDRVASSTGIEVEVLDGIEETRLAYGVLQQNLEYLPDFARSDSILMDLSAGSVRITVFHKGWIIFSESLRMGTLRLREMLSSAPRSQFVALIEELVENIVENVKRRVPLEALRNFLLISPDVARLGLGDAKEGGSAKITRIEVDRFENLVHDVSALQSFELAERFNLHADEAEALPPALIAIHTFLTATMADHITLLGVNMQKSLLSAMATGGGLTAAGEAEFQEQIASCAVGIGRKYHFDEAHSLHVGDLALQVFDQVAPQHGLVNADRILLRVAAILHDIGSFISARAHHKHSMYLVANSECFGLTAEQMTLISQICRYHRRAMPRSSHIEYMRLTPNNRMRVSKLAAILRLADSLDSNHTGSVHSLACRFEGDRLWLLARSNEDIALDQMALLNKRDLFEEMFGYRVELRREGDATM